VGVPAAEQTALSPEAGLPRLSMIVRNQYEHYAVIDGHPRRVGEQWAGYRLLAIQPSSVLLERDGNQVVELGLLPDVVIKKLILNDPVGGSSQGDTRRAESREGFRNNAEGHPHP
ncbi:MAG: hypothetical protein ABWU16_08830, partial [Halothiobacillaceae bacterium]